MSEHGTASPDIGVKGGQPDPREVMRDRYRACLLGGAVGDALGYPVEFLREPAIWKEYGLQGIQTLEQAGNPAPISDDTQMTLFAANAIVYAKEQGMTLSGSLWTAYQEWLGTQGDVSRMDDPEQPKMWVYRDRRMHALRAPGNTCMAAIRNGPAKYCPGYRADNDSKGCGTVMRAAPWGLAVPQKDCYGDGPIAVYKMALGDAWLTHGHPMAGASSAALAQIVFQIVQYRPGREYRLEEAVSQIGFPGDAELRALLERAVRLALDPSVSDLDGIHALGEGWVADEALAIAVFCAVRYQDDFAAAIRAAVNHKGDSDSTGAICGNLLGAWLGTGAVATAFDLDHLELRDVIEKMADQLFEAVEGPDRPPQPSPAPEEKAPYTPPEPMPQLRTVGLKYTPLTKTALSLCFAAHRDQRDKSGLPYVFHPFHLAERMETEEEICTALLHDVVEDTCYTLEDLCRAGFPERVLEALRLLTRVDGEGYLAYVTRVRQNPIARRVKLADLEHNGDLARLEQVTERDRRRALKYRMARAILEDDRYDRSLGRFQKRIPLTLSGPYYLSVFYTPGGTVLSYSFDAEEPGGAHCTFDAGGGEKLLQALGGADTLPEALARRMPMNCGQLAALLRSLKIPYDLFD